jgi:3-deoxy-D-manno-octulosonate 8-phosphate phosphatase (KDO 8-P phosphatase)
MTLGAAEIDARARRIKVLAFDVDGVCTDGRLYYGPDGCALHAFHARDGLGLVRARLAGLVCAAISGRASRNVDARLGELKVPYIRQGIMHKDRELQTILNDVGASLDEVCFVGDDVNDLCCLRTVGLAVAPADADPAVLLAVHMVTGRSGGQGVLREVVERILRAQGRWSDDDRVTTPQNPVDPPRSM